MFVEQLTSAIAGASTLSTVNNLSKLVWKAYEAGHIPEEAAQSAAEAIRKRQIAIRARADIHPSLRPDRPRKQRSPDRQRSIERRRHLAMSGVLPGHLACKFTVGEMAVLKIIGDECRRHGSCSLYIDAIAARSGTSRSTVQRAVRQAQRIGLITMRERRRAGQLSLTNIIRIVSKEWQTWIDRRRPTSFVSLSGTRGVSFLKPTNPRVSSGASAPCE